VRYHAHWYQMGPNLGFSRRPYLFVWTLFRAFEFANSSSASPYALVRENNLFSVLLLPRHMRSTSAFIRFGGGRCETGPESTQVILITNSRRLVKQHDVAA
jgi:hypothetical protein